MQANIIAIGNSKGIRLPKSVIDRYHLSGKVEIILEENQILLRPIIDEKPRKGWDAAFAQMHAAGEDALMLPDSFDDEEHEPW